MLENRAAPDGDVVADDALLPYEDAMTPLAHLTRSKIIEDG
jgi:hypothetical protein